MISKQFENEHRVHSGSPYTLKNSPFKKSTSQKTIIQMRKDDQKRPLFHKMSYKRTLQKENSLKERKSFSLFSKQNSRTNLPYKIKRKSIGAFSLHRNHYSDVRRNSSSIVQTSEPESEVNISNDISMEEEKMNKNEGQEYSEDKISNNNESNFSRIEEEESSNTSEQDKSENNSDNNKTKWSKRYKNKIFEKFKKMVKIVNHKMKSDYNSILLAMQNNEDDKVYEILIDPEFKQFYRNKDNLYEKDVFMDEMVIYKKFDLLKKVYQDPAYEFDKDYIFKILFYCISPNLFSKYKEDLKLNINKEKKGIICVSFNYEYFNNALNMGEFLEKYIQIKEMKNFRYINDKTILEIIIGLVENNLYDNTDIKKVRIIAWFMSLLGLNDSLSLILKNNKKLFLNSIEKHNNNEENDLLSFSNLISDINEIKSVDVKKINLYTITYYLKTIEDCLSSGFEDLAILLANLRRLYPELIETYKKAVKFENMMYLKFMWEKSIDYNKKIMKDMEYRIIGINRYKKRENDNKLYYIDIGEIVTILINNHRNDKYDTDLNNKITKIFEWKNIEQETSLLKSLFDNNFFFHICYFLKHWPPEKINKEEYFKKAIEFKQKELILFYLNKPEMVNVLYNKKIQKIIVNEYIPNGELFYYGAECLSYIYKKKWDINLTKKLCNNITKIIKTKDILNCHSPILTCLLLHGFIRQIRYLSSSDTTKCTKVLDLLIEFCQSVQESIHDESSISYLMKQKDTRERTAFQIVSDNKIYQLLETSEIGTVIKKMRDGVLNANGIINTSSLHRFLFDNNKVNNPFNSFQKINPNKVYFFQLNAKLDGCHSRINEVGIFSIILAFVYQLYIYMLNENEEVLNNFEEISKEARIFYYIYLILVHILIYNLIIEKIFFYFSKRKMKIEFWDYMDILLLISAWLCILDTKRFTGEYKDDNIAESTKDLIWSLQIPVLKNLKIEDSSLSTQVSFWIRIVILSVNDLIVWSRVTGILLYYRQIGPVIRTIFTMGKILIKYIFIIIFFMACCAGIFTCIFNRHSHQFVDFSTSVISLFGAFLNDFDCYDFDSNYKVAGSIILLIYVCIASVLFINLLIVIISHGFQKINKVVESSHRAVLINYCKKFKWHKKYGYLIFLSPPFNLLILPILLLNLLYILIQPALNAEEISQAQKNFNVCITRFLFSVTYFPFNMLCFIIYSIILIPFTYIKGIIRMIIYLSSIKNSKIYKVYYFMIWFFFGILFILSILLKDIYYCYSYIFTEIERKDDEFLRMTKNLTDKDVVNIFKFIHSPKAMEFRNDVHSMFLAFLDFEREEEGLTKENKNNKNTKMVNTNYDNKSTKRLQKKYTKKDEDIQNKISTRNILIPSVDNAGSMTTKIRKNLMLIETLENFTFNDDSVASSSVNVTKMRKLLPLVINVKKKHYNRLVYSHVSVLEAMSKITENKINFRQYLLTKQILECASNIDKQIDIEINKLQNKMKEKKKNVKKKNKRRNSIVKAMNTFIINNKGSIVDINSKLLKDEENKKNIIVELQSVKDFYSMLEKMKILIEGIIKKKDSGSQ